MCVASVVAATVVSAQSRLEPPSLETLLAAVRGYLIEYQHELSYVIADEAGTQRILRQIPGVPGTPSSRNTKAEIHFRVVPELGAWMAIRDVTAVDGVPVEKRADLRAELEKRGLADVASDVKTYNSRFNIGRITRNFNEPTLALGLLDESRADTLTFTIRSRRTERGTRLVTLGFKEVPGDNPFVVDLQRGQAPADGEIVLEEATGRIRRTRLRVAFETGPAEAVLTTIYTRDDKLDLWVPSEFRETYEDGIEGRSGSWLAGGRDNAVATSFESIYCESKYSNFRRFQATARIK